MYSFYISYIDENITCIKCTPQGVKGQYTSHDTVVLTEISIPTLTMGDYDISIDIEDIEDMKHTQVMTIHPDTIQYDFKISEKIYKNFSENFLESQKNFENIFVVKVPFEYTLEDYDVIKFSKNSSHDLLMKWGKYETIISLSKIKFSKNFLQVTCDAELFKNLIPNKPFVMQLNNDYPICIEYDRITHFIAPVCN
jgi:hypothetical protein